MRDCEETLSAIFQKSSYYVDAEQNWLGIKIARQND